MNLNNLKNLFMFCDFIQSCSSILLFLFINNIFVKQTQVFDHIMQHYAVSREHLSLGFPAKSDTDGAVQQKARSL